MDKRWQEIERIYHAARELNGNARAEFLAKACAADGALRDEVESLLAHGDQAGSFLETSPAEMAAKVFGKGERSPAASTSVLELGTMVAHYRVTASLGAGGMGEVYRARDTKLQRDVALKILPQALARDAERMARFEREAQVLASLNHPNIAAIYGLEESNGIRALAMELVEGETLAEKIVGEGSALPREPKGLPYQDALPLARQIAEALEYAHEHGIIHRDLKPANVKITPEGAVKVLDFGLAKVLSPQDSTAALDPANSPTLSMTATEKGMILGTAAYMSPEQAKGLKVDRRCDIWAFGCVLYEMLSGRKAFEGETISDVLAAVLTKEPNLAELPANTPSGTQNLIRRCLVKDAKQRLRDIGDARIAIEEALSGSSLLASPLPPGEGGPEERDRVRVSPLRRALPWAAGAVLVCVAAVVGWWLGNRNAVSSAAWSGDLLPGPTIAVRPRVSPDGRLIAFIALVDNLAQVAVMDPASGNWTVLTHDRTQGSLDSLCWSHDGSRIYFDRDISSPIGVYSVPSLGGEERLVLADAASPETLFDGSLLVVRVDPDRRNQIYHYWPDTGRLQALGAWVDTPEAPAMRVFPEGKEVVFFGTVKGNDGTGSHLYLADLTTGSARRLAPELPVFASSATLPLAVTLDGKSVLIDLPSGNLHRIVAIPRSGEGPVKTLITPTSQPWSLDVAPDGSLYLDQVDRPLEMLRVPRAGGTPDVLASGESYNFQTWNGQAMGFPDGRVLLRTLISGRSRLLLGRPGGNFVSMLQGNEETSPPMVQVGNDEVALMVGSPPGQALAIASVREGRIIHRFTATEGIEINEVAVSPDGNFLYYVSSGSIWSISSQGESPRKLCAGDGVAVDPNGRDLIVNFVEREGVRLERVPLSGGPAQPIQVRSDLLLAPLRLAPGALNKDGKLVVDVAPKDSSFLGLAMLNLATGELKQIPVSYSGDMWVPDWASNGSILVTASPIRAHIWRFRPAH